MARLAGPEGSGYGAGYASSYGPSGGALPGPPAMGGLSGAPAMADPGVVPLEQGFLGAPSPIPTRCLLLKNLFDPLQETEPNWWVDIAEDVKEECSKHGPVDHIFVDKDSKVGQALPFQPRMRIRNSHGFASQAGSRESDTSDTYSHMPISESINSAVNTLQPGWASSGSSVAGYAGCYEGRTSLR